MCYKQKCKVVSLNLAHPVVPYEHYQLLIFIGPTPTNFHVVRIKFDCPLKVVHQIADQYNKRT